MVQSSLCAKNGHFERFFQNGRHLKYFNEDLQLILNVYPKDGFIFSISTF